MLGRERLVTDIFNGNEFRLIRSVPYKTEYLKELTDCCFMCVLEIEKKNGDTIFAACKDLINNDVLLQITNEEDVLLSDIGTAKTILWFACLKPLDVNAPQEAVKVVQKAASFVGITDKPLHSNHIIFNQHFRGADEILDDDWWCAAFIWDVFRMCELNEPIVYGRKFQDCKDILDWGKKENLLLDSSQGRYGDIALFHWDDDDSDAPSHASIIAGVMSDGGYLTIDGCTSELSNKNGGCVNYRFRSQKNIVAIVRPHYRS